MTSDPINAQLVTVGVNMGDHGETVVRFVEVDENETVRALLERLLPAGSQYTTRDYDNFVKLGFAQPLPEGAPAAPEAAVSAEELGNEL
jgi:hypothetical protein